MQILAHDTRCLDEGCKSVIFKYNLPVSIPVEYENKSSTLESHYYDKIKFVTHTGT